MTHKPMNLRQHLQQAAARIAARHGRPRSGPWRAFSKLFLAPRWAGDGVRASGLRRWKPGELWEWAAAGSPADRSEEWGDVGYYVAQTWGWLWRLYEIVTPAEIVDRAVAKFERRAERIRMRTLTFSNGKFNLFRKKRTVSLIAARPRPARWTGSVSSGSISSETTEPRSGDVLDMTTIARNETEALDAALAERGLCRDGDKIIVNS